MAKRKPQTAEVVAAKAAKFKELAEARGNRCLNDIRLLGNLATSQYVSTDEQRKVLFGTLHAALDSVEARFSGTKDNGPRISL